MVSPKWNPGCGILFVLSAPSGTGKTTLANYLVQHVPDMVRSVSFTTRPKREGEKDGIDYNFVDREMFEKMIRGDEFAEYARVHDNYYGTSIGSIHTAKKEGKDLILVIDVQGAESIRKQAIDSVSVFLLPPSMEILRERLGGRGTEKPEAIERRIHTARKEIEQCRKYDYIVVNDELSKTESNLAGIVWAERCKASRINPVFKDFAIPTVAERGK